MFKSSPPAKPSPSMSSEKIKKQNIVSKNLAQRCRSELTTTMMIMIMMMMMMIRSLPVGEFYLSLLYQQQLIQFTKRLGSPCSLAIHLCFSWTTLLAGFGTFSRRKLLIGLSVLCTLNLIFNVRFSSQFKISEAKDAPERSGAEAEAMPLVYNEAAAAVTKVVDEAEAMRKVYKETAADLAEAKAMLKVCKEQKTKAKKKKKRMDCEGFPGWPLSPGIALYDENVGEPQCDPNNSVYPWLLHQTSAPNRRPSNEEVKATLSNLPSETGYLWHTNEDICAFMRTQPLRFQALYNSLTRSPHKVDLWRYLLLYQRGGVYLDDDARLQVQFNSSFVKSVDSVYTTQSYDPKNMGITDDEQRPFGYTIYNGLLISKPCNRVLLSVAERMVQIGDLNKERIEGQPWENDVVHPSLTNWYNLKLLAIAIAERAPAELHPDVKCLAAGPGKCRFLEPDTRYTVPFKWFKKSGELHRNASVIRYKDDHDWTTAVFDARQCGGMVVNQVAGGKHDAVSVDPHPSPWVPATYNRMVFTHVGKAGGSFLIQLMEALAKRNQFTVVKGSETVGFNPPRQKLFEDIISLKNNTVYENHACYVNGLDDRDFISIVRDPFDLMNSHFYYGVDTEIRKEKAVNALKNRKEDKLCGCFNLEFDQCIDTKYKNNCTIKLPSQIFYFCEHRDSNCTLDVAISNVEKYALVGITEEMSLTVELLEKVTPWVFGGQAEQLAARKNASEVSERSTNIFNPVTNTSLHGATSIRTRQQIKERAVNYKDEIEFYNRVKKLFWRKAVQMSY